MKNAIIKNVSTIKFNDDWYLCGEIIQHPKYKVGIWIKTSPVVAYSRPILGQLVITTFNTNYRIDGITLGFDIQLFDDIENLA